LFLAVGSISKGGGELMPKIVSPAISVALAGVLLSVSIGCSKSPSNDTVAKEIQSRVSADPDLKESNITVAAKDGKVTLTGTASSPAAQQKVAQIASQEPGISSVDNETSVPPPPPPPIVVPAGTDLVVILSQALGSKLSQTGQTFLATTAQPVSVNGQVAIPKGSTVNGTVVAAKEKGKIKGEGQLTLTLRSVTINGQTYPIQTVAYDSTVKGKGKRTAVTTGGGAAGGALIGGLAGGGKGAGIGALVGAGAGFVGGAFTGNKQIELPAETAVTFPLSAPLTLPPPSQ
jgi:BON domain